MEADVKWLPEDMHQKLIEEKAEKMKDEYSCKLDESRQLVAKDKYHLMKVHSGEMMLVLKRIK